MDVTGWRPRRRLNAEQLSAAALRAVAGKKGLNFEYGQVYDADQLLAIYAPHLRLATGDGTLASCRGVVDAMAMRLICSDAALHACQVPQDRLERFLFEWLEQLRVESIVPDYLPGVRNNLMHRYRSWSCEFINSGSTETRLGILLFAFSQIVWSRLAAQPLSEHIQDLLESTRAALAPALGTAFTGIRQNRYDQAHFAPYALQIVRYVARRVREEEADGSDTITARGTPLVLPVDAASDEMLRGDVDLAEERPAFIAIQKESYRVFTHRYDQESFAADLLRPAQLQAYRVQLDSLVARQRVNVARLSRLLRSALVLPQPNGWRFGQEAGVVDGRRLARLITSPDDRYLFRDEQISLLTNCTVSFLIDCSGSMKRYVESVAVMIDILMHAFDRADVSTEVLGFTTLAWNGGRAKADWMAQGRKESPGRLNEIRHFVFKKEHMPWKQARRSLAAILKTDLFREGIDGEAVDWACKRLLARACERRILVVVSDGCPADTATNLANSAGYLEGHLKSTIAYYSTQYPIEIIGIGVGRDLGSYYPRSLAVDLSEKLDNKVFDEFLQLLESS